MRRSRVVGAVLVVVAALLGSSCSSGDSAEAPGTTTPPTSEAPTTTLDTGSSPEGLPPPDSFATEEVVIGEPPIDLGGTLRLPAGSSLADPVAGVVVVHDFGPNDRDGTRLGLHPYRDLGEGLADGGVATLTYDKRTNAHGDAFLDADYTVAEETVDDAVAAVELLAARPEVDAERVFVVGHGLGGMLAPRIADRTALAGLVLLDAPSRPLPDVTIDQFEYLANLDGEVSADEQAQLDEVRAQAAAIADPGLSPDTPADALLGYPALYWLDLRDYDPVAALAEADVDALALQGGRSFEVTDADYERWAAAAETDDRLTVERFDDLNHYFVAGTESSSPDEYARAGVMDPRVIDTILEFVEGPQGQ